MAERGFTLLEVMVALAVLAIALGAALQTAATGSRQLAELEARTVAGWVAQNVVAELQLVPDWPAPGIREGVQSQLGREWNWQARIEATNDSDLRRVEVRVQPRQGEGAGYLLAALPRPAPPADEGEAGAGPAQDGAAPDA